MNKLRESGFTLVELIVVILILGILSAIAVPKFVNLQGSARAAALNGLRAAVSSASTLANAVQQAAGSASNVSVTMEGTTVAMTNGYPSTASGIDLAVRFDSTVFQTTAGNPMTFSVTSAPGTCNFTYTAATTAVPPVISAATTTGC
jgi:MSHA pilin protein MshA